MYKCKLPRKLNENRYRITSKFAALNADYTCFPLGLREAEAEAAWKNHIQSLWNYQNPNKLKKLLAIYQNGGAEQPHSRQQKKHQLTLMLNKVIKLHKNNEQKMKIT